MSIGGDVDDSSTLLATTDVNTVDGGRNVKNNMMTYDVKSSAVVVVESSSLFRRQQRRRRIHLKLQLLLVFIVILSLLAETFGVMKQANAVNALTCKLQTADSKNLRRLKWGQYVN